MAVNATNAVAAYMRQAKLGEAPGLEAGADPAKSFANMVGDALRNAVETGHAAEKMSAAALAGKADINEVVTAVTNAEVTLQSVLAVRDRVIQAYQDILRMPI